MAKNALTQYIDLFRSARNIIDSHSSPVLNARREEACRVLEETTLPAEGAENYEHTDLEKMLAPDFGLNLAGVNIDINPAASFRCDVPDMQTMLYLTLNDTPMPPAPGRGSLPDGVTAGSLKSISLEYPELVDRYYGRLASISNPLVALDTMLCQDGFMIHVAKGVRVEQPLQLVNILNNGRPLMAVRRVLIVLEEGAELTLLTCDHTQNPDVEFLALQTVEIYAGPNSRLDFYDMEESTERTSRLSSLYLSQEQGSNVLIDGITLFNGTTRNEYHTVFNGSDASLRLLGMGIEDRRRHIETYSYVDHKTGHCHTDELMKFVVDDESIASFSGRIYVAPGAVKTEAYQSNRNIVGSDTARMFSKPQLEIYNDDVKCSHGTAIGQLDPMQLFYMRTRGLEESTARLLLKQAFMADVIDGVRLDSLRDRLRLLVERRFAGASSACSSCTRDCGAVRQDGEPGAEV